MYGGRYVIVNNFGSNLVSVIDTVTDTVRTTDIGGAPLGISFISRLRHAGRSCGMAWRPSPGEMVIY